MTREWNARLSDANSGGTSTNKRKYLIHHALSPHQHPHPTTPLTPPPLGACVISCVSLSAKEFILDTVVPVFRKGLFSKKYNVDSYWKSFQTMDHFPGWPNHPSFLLLLSVPKRERWREGRWGGSWLEGVVGNEDKKEGYGTVIWRRHMVRVRKAVETGPG